jgi:hypothetical protein
MKCLQQHPRTISNDNHSDNRLSALTKAFEIVPINKYPRMNGFEYSIKALGVLDLHAALRLHKLPHSEEANHCVAEEGILGSIKSEASETSFRVRNSILLAIIWKSWLACCMFDQFGKVTYL